MRTRWLLVLAVILGASVGCATRQPGGGPGVAMPRKGLAIQMNGPDVVLTWPAAADTEYTVLYTDDLLVGAWAPLPDAGNLAGTGGLMSVRDSTPSAKRYYRLHTGPFQAVNPADK